MNKKYLVICLSLLAVLGSLFVAYAVNMFFSDIVNIAVGFSRSTFFASLPAIALALSFTFATLFVLRAYKYQKALRKLAKRFLIIVCAFGFVGVLGAILAMAVTYKSALSPGPFPAYLIVFMILNLAVIGGAVFGLLNVKKLKEDEEPLKMGVGYIFKSIGWVLFILLTYDRFGTLLVSPTFIYWRTLYMTFPFYIFLAVPMYLGVVEALYVLELVDLKKIRLMGIIGGAAALCLFIYCVIMGLSTTTFIAALSQCMPLERISSKPLEILFHILAYVGVSVAIFLQTRKPKEA